MRTTRHIVPVLIAGLFVSSCTNHDPPEAPPTSTSAAPSQSSDQPVTSPSATSGSEATDIARGTRVSEAELLPRLGFTELPQRPDLTAKGERAAMDAGAYFLAVFDYATYLNKPELIEGDEFEKCQDCKARQEGIRQLAAADTIDIYERKQVAPTSATQNAQHENLVDVIVVKDGGRLVGYDRKTEQVTNVVPKAVNVQTIVIGYYQDRGWLPVMLDYSRAAG